MKSRPSQPKARCRLFGCVLDEHGPACIHCGLQYYEGFVHLEESIVSGRWHRFHYWVSSKNPIRRCDHCRKLFLTRTNGACCSEACYSEWVPF